MTENYLGSILLKNRLITQAQLDQALQKQRQQAETRGWQLLGEILIEAQMVSCDELETVLGRQAQLNEIEYFDLCTHPSTRSVSKRVLDLLGSLLGLSMMFVLLPFIAIAIYLDSPGSIFIAQPRVGLRGKQFKLWRFRTTTLNAEQYRLKVASEVGSKLFDQKNDPNVTRVGRILRRFYLDEMPQFFNVLKGEMSLVGTRPPTLDEVKLYSRNDWKRLSVKPGMTGLWQVNRHKYGMDFESVLAIDNAYIDRWQYHSDIKILSNTAVHIFMGPVKQRIQGLKFASEYNKVGVLNIPIDNMSVMELLEQLKSGVVLTPNVDHLMKLQKDPDFFRTYALADYKVCDSQVLMYASRFLGTPFKEKISGSDFFPLFCDYHKHNEDITVFLLGGAAGVADKARSKINSKIGRAIVIGSHSPSFGFEKDEQECLEIIEIINQSRASVLAVGVGAPKQEKWIYKYKHKLPHVKIFLAVGATIDFEAGVIQRSPKWISTLGLEWLFRIYCDPQRLWKRYLLEDLPFFWLLLQQKLGIYTSPRFEASSKTDKPANAKVASNRAMTKGRVPTEV